MRKRRAVTTAVALMAIGLVISRRVAGQQVDSTTSATVPKVSADAAHHAVTAAALGHARDALERVARFRGLGDEIHANAAEGLAREWAETARDLALAVDAETTAAAIRRKAMDAQARLERARALVEVDIARVGRLRSELDGAARTVPKEHVALEIHAGDHALKQPVSKDGAPHASPGIGKP